MRQKKAAMDQAETALNNATALNLVTTTAGTIIGGASGMGVSQLIQKIGHVLLGTTGGNMSTSFNVHEKQRAYDDAKAAFDTAFQAWVDCLGANAG